MPHFLYIFIIFLGLNGAPVQAQDLQRGHVSVTQPKNCAAIIKDENAPALHYMTHAYKRCIEMSRKILRAEKSKTQQEDTREINKSDVSYKEESGGLKNYYRVTPRKKDQEDE